MQECQNTYFTLSVIALANYNRLQQIAAVNSRQLQSRDLKIVYNSEWGCRSAPFLSLALDSHL